MNEKRGKKSSSLRLLSGFLIIYFLAVSITLIIVLSSDGNQDAPQTAPMGPPELSKELTGPEKSCLNEVGRHSREWIAQIQTLLKKVEEGQSSTAVSLRGEPYGTDAFYDYSWNPYLAQTELESIYDDTSEMLESFYRVDDRCKVDFADFHYDIIFPLIYDRQAQLRGMYRFRSGLANDSIYQLVGPRTFLKGFNGEKRWMCSNLINSLKDHEYEGSPITTIQDLANASGEDYWLEYWAELQC